MSALPVGRYKLSFELNGFKKYTRSDVLIEAVVTRQLNITLEVGAMTEQVTVSGDAPLVVANTAATYRRLAADELTQIPTSTRSFTHLLVGGGRRQQRVATGAHQRHRQHLAVGQRHAHDQHEPVFQRHRCDESSRRMKAPCRTTSRRRRRCSRRSSCRQACMTPPPAGQAAVTSSSSRGAEPTAYHGGVHFAFQNEAFNANDFFYERDGIDKPKARRNEGGLDDWRTAAAEQGVLLRRLSADRCGDGIRSDGQQPHRAACGAQVGQRSADEGKPAGRILGAEPRNLGVDSEGPVQQRDRHGVYLGRSGGALQPAQPGDR